MKCCSKCGSHKEIDEFHWRNQNKNLRSSWCKICISLETKKRFIKNPSYFNKKNHERREKNRKWLNEIKKSPCVDCKKLFPPICMDFDHIDGVKIGNIGNMLNDVGIESLKKEIEKCELVCACCHRIRTEKRRLSAS